MNTANTTRAQTASDMMITCGKCGGVDSIENWTERPVSGPLPKGQFQCPACGLAFQRREVTPGKLLDNGRDRLYLPGKIALVPCQPMP